MDLVVMEMTHISRCDPSTGQDRLQFNPLDDSAKLESCREVINTKFV